ncbi:RNA polymerase sigma factor [Catalinimonas niigatensis]|uniref:RNA polymerase sigma factor n=1 Tax=Catalinimonas niigatensis TaxID=1397264 RepID=UPI00266638F6|nr:RNA polymerase sigma factor [Catalinimonas niigatensis]WPP51583.1 RNA polymerase sigma factor [Catalinimonas niigatensis]
MGEDNNPYQSEEELIKGIINKDSKALHYLYAAYGPSLYGMLYSMLRQQQTKAEELLVLTFVKLFEDIHAFDAKKRKLFTHMMHIARNLATAHHHHGESSPTPPHDLNQSDISAVHKNRAHDSFADLLSRLPSEQEEIFRLVFLEGETYAQVASKKSRALEKVKTMMRAAMVKIRELLHTKA